MTNIEQAHAIIRQIPRLDKLVKHTVEINANKPYIIGVGAQALLYLASTPIDEIKQFFPVNGSLIQFIQLASFQGAIASARRMFASYPPEKKNRWKRLESMLGLYAIGLFNTAEISKLFEKPKASKDIRNLTYKVQLRMTSIKDVFVSIKHPPPIVAGYYRIIRHKIPPRLKNNLELMLFDISKGRSQESVFQKYGITPNKIKALKKTMQEWGVDHSFIQTQTKTSVPDYKTIMLLLQDQEITDQDLLKLRKTIGRKFIDNHNKMFRTVSSIIGHKIPFTKLQPFLDNHQIPYFLYENKGYVHIRFAVQQTIGERGERLRRLLSTL